MKHFPVLSDPVWAKWDVDEMIATNNQRIPVTGISNCNIGHRQPDNPGYLFLWTKSAFF